MRRWLPLVILAAAQFIMVLDTTVMNVAISQVVEDLDTTVQNMQAAITLYALVMAAFMLAGAKLGDMFGRKRIFLVGLGVYGLGSLTTALAPNMTVLYLGWSLVEGLGAVLVVPAIAALVVGNYEGGARATAYGVLGGVAAAGAAAGPLIGGWATTYLSWRYVFAGEVVLVVAVILLRGALAAPPDLPRRPRFDGVGTALSAAGLGLTVIGILMSGTWGWVRPLAVPSIGGVDVTPLGFSCVPFLICAGLGVLAGFLAWQRHLVRVGRDPLLDPALLDVGQLRAGLTSLAAQQILIMGVFFIIPVFLQIVVGLDAFQTGLRIMPMSLTMLVAAMVAPRFASRRSPRRLVWAGLSSIVVSALLLTQVVDVELDTWEFVVATSFFGFGAGLLASQLGNVIMSSVDRARSSEAGGLQGTAQNVGASLGTALIGSVLMLSLASGFTTGISDNPEVPEDVRSELVEATSAGVPVVTVDEVEQALVAADVDPGTSRTVAAEYGDAQLAALEQAIGALALLAFVSFGLTRNLPTRPLVGSGASGVAGDDRG